MAWFVNRPNPSMALPFLTLRPAEGKEYQPNVVNRFNGVLDCAR